MYFFLNVTRFHNLIELNKNNTTRYVSVNNNNTNVYCKMI